jgi:hypothetical protein
MEKIALKSRLLLKPIYLLAFFSILSSCQNEELSTLTNDTTTNKKSEQTLKTGTTIVVAPTSVPSGDCTTDCIKAEGPYFETTDQKIIYWGGSDGKKFSKTVDITYYNTATDFVLKVKSTEGWSDLVIDGVSSWTGGSVAANTWETYTIPLASGWKACDLISFKLKVTKGGSPAEFDVAYSLFGLCPECETSFAGEAISCGTAREAIFTFKSDKDISSFKIQGGLTNFTGTNADITVTGGTNITKGQVTPGASSNRVIKVEGSIAKCSEVTIKITWNSTNSGGIITGSWSVKDANGVEIAPSVDGLECN